MSRYPGAVHEELWNAVRRQWVLPKRLNSQRLETMVVVVVRRDGKILDLRTDRSSGNPEFDESAKKAVHKAEPLPPFPAIYSAAQEEIGLHFRPQELAGNKSAAQVARQKQVISTQEPPRKETSENGLFFIRTQRYHFTELDEGYSYEIYSKSSRAVKVEIWRDGSRELEARLAYNGRVWGIHKGDELRFDRIPPPGGHKFALVKSGRI